MIFRVWFKRWLRAFRGMVRAANGEPYQSERMREKKKRMRRLRAEKNHFYHPKKKRREPKAHRKMLQSIINFLFVSAELLLLPLFWLGRRGQKNKKRKSDPVGRGAKEGKQKESPKSDSANKASVPQTKTQTKFSAQPKKEEKPIEPTHEPYESFVARPPKNKSEERIDESIPKSKPKSLNDRYIRKRMIIAGSYYCDESVLASLRVGSCFDLVAEPENPYDANAIKLVYQGEKIGYVAKSDLPAFSACLKLQKKIYGVITDIQTDRGRVQYEYETWFESV